MITIITIFFACLSVAAKANPNLSTLIDPGICADAYDAVTSCYQQKPLFGFGAGGLDNRRHYHNPCMNCLGAGQADHENPTCSQFDCQAFEDCITASCIVCTEEYRSMLQCVVKRDCSITCEYNHLRRLKTRRSSLVHSRSTTSSDTAFVKS